MSRRLLLALALALGLVLLPVPVPVRADNGAYLAGLIATHTGLPRTYDAYLESVARTRSAEVPLVWGHRPMPELSAWSWGEVIAVNRGYADPYAQVIIQWHNSGPHHAVIHSPAYLRVGCDHRSAPSGSDGVVRDYFVCIFGTLGTWAPAPPPPAPAPPAPGPITDVLTDTSMLGP